MIILAIVLLVGGLGLSLLPLQAVRAAGKLRSMPGTTDVSPQQVTAWRLAGVAITVVGIVLLLLG